MLILVIRNTGFKKAKQLKQRWKYLGNREVADLPFQVLIVLKLVRYIFDCKGNYQNIFNKYLFRADYVPGTVLSNFQILIYLKIKLIRIMRTH